MSVNLSACGTIAACFVFGLGGRSSRRAGCSRSPLPRAYRSRGSGARVGLVGLLRPSLGRAIDARGYSRSYRAERLGHFFSAIAVFCGAPFAGFPLGAVVRGLPPRPSCRVFAMSTPFLSASAVIIPRKIARN